MVVSDEDDAAGMVAIVTGDTDLAWLSDCWVHDSSLLFVVSVLSLSISLLLCPLPSFPSSNAVCGGGVLGRLFSRLLRSFFRMVDGDGDGDDDFGDDANNDFPRC